MRTSISAPPWRAMFKPRLRRARVRAEYFHKPSWKQPGTHATDRKVMWNGEAIARIRRDRSGDDRGQWEWSLWWPCPQNHGRCKSLDEALDMVRKRHQQDGRPIP